MRDFDKLVKSARRRIESVFLVDDILRDHAGGIPFLDRTSPNWRYEVDDSKGIDCGFLYLQDFYVRLLKAKSVEPIELNVFSDGENEKFDNYGMIGFPAESLSLDLTGERARTPVTLAYFPLNRLGIAESTNNYSDHYRITEVGSVNDIDGVSGAPVLGFIHQNNGLIDYKLAGIQCGWYPSEKRIYCTSAAVCGGFLLSSLSHWGITLQ